MIQNFRDNLKGTGAVIIVGIICVPFALVGVEQLFFSGSQVDTVAEIEGERVSQFDLDRAVRQDKQSIVQQYEGIDIATIDDAVLVPMALERLVQSKVIKAAAEDSGMAIPQNRVNKEIIQVEQFQRDGKFDQDTYRFALQQIGHTVATFSSAIKEDFINQQFRSGVISSAFVTQDALANLAALTNQTRDYYYLLLPIADATANVNVTPEALQQYYQDNLDKYLAPEKVVVNYIELKSSELEQKINVTDADILDRFEQEKQTVQIGESRLAAHILISDDDEAAAKIDEIKAKLAAGEEFATLASEYSEDFGSAEFGGELGFTTGDTFPVEFEAALAALEVGEVSEPTKTESGIHLIKLIDIQKNAFELENERERIEKDLRREMAAEELQITADELRNAVYSADNLEDPAKEFDLTLAESEAFTRDGGSGIAAYPAIVKAAFSDNVLVEKVNSDVIEVNPGHYVVLHVKEHQPAHTLTFEEVEQQVNAQYTRMVAVQSLQEKAEELLARVNAGSSIEQLATDEQLTWQAVLGADRSGADQDGEILRQVFTMPVPQTGPVNQVISKVNGDVAVVSLASVNKGSIDTLSEIQRAALANAAMSASGQQELVAYVKQLRDDAKVEIEEDLIAQQP